MKNIALVANAENWILTADKNHGGGNVVAYNIYKVLNSAGYNITIICFGDKPDYTKDNLTVKYIDINLSIESEEFTRCVAERAKDCDKIINFMTQNIFDGVLIQSHSYLYRTSRANKLFIPIKKFLYRKKIRYQKELFSKNIQYAYAVSKGIKEDYGKNFGIKNIKVSYPGCANVYDEFNDKTNDVLTFGLIANSSINKSGHYCIFALGLAKLCGLKFRFELIAPGYEKNFVMRFLLNIFGLKKITNILPKQSDMKNFYESIDCVIMPSVHEAFGLVPLESMSYCKTCLVSDNIGFAELIDENSGFKFNRLSFGSFLKAILRIGNIFYKDREKFNEIRKNGWLVSKRHTWEDFVNGLLD